MRSSEVQLATDAGMQGGGHVLALEQLKTAPDCAVGAYVASSQPLAVQRRHLQHPIRGCLHHTHHLCKRLCDAAGRFQRLWKPLAFLQARGQNSPTG